MNELPPFNPSRRPQKSDPGLGDDVPCIKCSSPLDTGLLGITVYVVPDDDEELKHIPQGSYGLGLNRCLVRASDWHAMRTGLLAAVAKGSK